MKLILSKFDSVKKIVIVYALPNQNISDEIQNNLKLFHDKFEEEIKGKEQIIFDFGPYLNYIFNVPSAWYPEVNETLILTLYFEEHENTTFFQPILKETVKKLKSIPNFTKILYLNTPHTDSEALVNLGKTIQILTQCFFEVNKKHATYNLGLAEIMILGYKGGGKTSIVEYLLNEKYIDQAVPTLTPRVYNLIYKQMDFRVLDVCCNQHIKEVFDDHPIEEGKLPQAIAYVVDSSIEGKKREDDIQDFKTWLLFLSYQYPEAKFPNIPILVLFNKTDLVENFNQTEFEKMYKPDIDNLNIKYGAVSAKTGIGLEENFSWLTKKIKITEKY